MVTTQREALVDAILRGQPANAAPWELAEAVTEVCRRIRTDPAKPVVEQTRLAAKGLNKGKWFDLARQVCGEWLGVRGFDFAVAKHLAQALINAGRLDDAEAALQDALQRAKQPVSSDTAIVRDMELPELEGLVGRLYKQRAVLYDDKTWLNRATNQYLRQYLDRPNHPYWHGINAVALMAREERDGIPARAGDGYRDYAARILADATKDFGASPADPWPAATASEASLALNQLDAAELWLYRFIHHPNARPFDLDSYARQLEEIWQLDPGGNSSAGGARLLSILRRHLESQGLLSLTPRRLERLRAELADAPHGLEQNFSGERFLGLATLRKLLRSCAGVACVTDRAGTGLGTGFIVNGLALHASFPDAPVLVTNAHVIGGTVPKSVAPAEARVKFEIESTDNPKPVFHEVEKVLFTSPPGPMGAVTVNEEALDISVAALRTWPNDPVCLSLSEALPQIDAKAKAYVVGHPRGSGLQISINDSELLDVDDVERLVHYRTPTDPGSSGSPVFNVNWDVIALHHGGSPKMPRLHGTGTYEANEGVSFRAIRAGIARAMQA